MADSVVALRVFPVFVGRGDLLMCVDPRGHVREHLWLMRNVNSHWELTQF